MGAVSSNRQQFVQRKARAEFEKNRAAPSADVGFLLDLARVQLENVSLQRQHLLQLKRTGHLKNP